MRKVTTINLNGRAYQLEDEGYEKLQTYLHQATQALHDNPDKTEVLADIEQAIADKCDQILTGAKNVVSTEQVTDILQQMGEVESGDGTSHKRANHESASAAGGPAKRLFTIKRGAMLLGVCNGIGAYLGVDPTLVRIAFIILGFATQGFAVIVYLALALFLPAAKTDTEIAEAYNRPMTAQDIANRAKERATDPETVERVGAVFTQVMQVIFRIVQIVAAVGFGLVTAGWLALLWYIVLGHFQLQGDLQALNGWRATLLASTAYAVAALPLLIIARIFGRLADTRHDRRETVSGGEGSLTAIWGIAVAALVLFGVMYGANFHNYVNDHQGNLDIGNHRYCVDETQCGPRDQTLRYRVLEN